MAIKRDSLCTCNFYITTSKYRANKSYLQLVKHQRECFQNPLRVIKEFIPFLPYTINLKKAQAKMKEMAKEILANRGDRNLKENEKIYLIDMMLKADPPLTEREVRYIF